ncbi:hypothetical protein [Aquitalea sp. LB_tupeE]|uniref:hypothetical protein n=1 Tax=Aquitalea sp. LB_tupeE TaxID=2748078 RepID=UPI0015BB74F8|nr:hypothetical protein [Aquitalea sp. LB_tupeE]NWK80135.1 hypothetical protein [Aquitalea sp. LB_tupeE]
MMKLPIHQLLLLFLVGSALPALTLAAGDGDIIIGREVPSRSAIRQGDPSPDVSKVSASPAEVIVGGTRQVVSIGGQAGEMVLGAVHGSVNNLAGPLPGLSATPLTVLSVTAAARPGTASGSGVGVGSAGISQQLQSGLQPLSGLAH